MLAQPYVGWHLTTMENSHLNSLTDMSDAFSSTKRETMEEASEQMFKGDPWMAQRLNFIVKMGAGPCHSFVNDCEGVCDLCDSCSQKPCCQCKDGCLVPAFSPP